MGAHSGPGFGVEGGRHHEWSVEKSKYERTDKLATKDVRLWRKKNF